MLSGGVKLTCDWRSSPEWRTVEEHGGSAGDALRSLGVVSAEFALWIRGNGEKWHPDEEVQLVLAEAQELIDRGIAVHVHPYVHQDSRGPGYLDSPTHDEVTSHMISAVHLGEELAALQGGETKLVFHAADNPAEEANEHGGELSYQELLFDRSREYFRSLESYVKRRDATGVRILCENAPPSERRIRVGQTPEEILSVVDGRDIDLCWDVGHQLNVADQTGISPIPPPEFLRRVSHVHWHSVVDGKDHRPATSDDPYLQECRDVLLDLQKDLSVTLEYAYRDQRHPDEGALDCIQRGLASLEERE